MRRSALCALLLALLPATALAGETESRSLFAEGRQLRTAGKCAEAIDLFRRALASHPEGLGALRNLAECEEELGRFASARRSWWDLRLAALQSNEAKYEGWADQAESAHKALASKIARVTVTSNRADVTITVAGRPLDPRLLGTELEMDTGSTEFSLRDGSVAPPTETLVLEQGQSYTVKLDSAFHADTTKGDPSDTNPPAGGTPDSDGGGPSAFVVTGIVGASVAGLSVLGLGLAVAQRSEALTTLEDLCEPNLDDCSVTTGEPGAAEAARSKGETASTLVNVFAVLGGIGVATSATFFILAATSDDSAPSDVSFSVSPTGGALRVRF